MQIVVRLLIINLLIFNTSYAQAVNGPTVRKFFKRFMKKNNSLIVRRTQEEVARKDFRYEEKRSDIQVFFGASAGFEHTKEYGIDPERNFGVIEGKAESFPSASLWVTGKKPLYDGGIQQSKVDLLKAKYEMNKVSSKKTKLGMSHGANHMVTNYFKHFELEQEFRKQEMELIKVKKMAKRMRNVRAITRFEYENVLIKLSVIKLKRSKNKLQLSFYRFQLGEYINLKKVAFKSKLKLELSNISESTFERKKSCKTEKLDIKELKVSEDITLADIRGLQGGLKPQFDVSFKAENKVRRNLEDETFDGRIMFSVTIPLGEHVRRGHLYDKYSAFKRLNRQQYEKAKNERARQDGSDLVLLHDYKEHFDTLEVEIAKIQKNKFLKIRALKKGGITLDNWLDLKERLSATELDYITTKWRIVFLNLRSQIACDGEIV